LFPDQTIFYFHTSIVNHFHNNILSAQRSIHIIEVLCRVPPKGVFLEGIIFVRNVMRVLDPLFFISSHGVGRHFMYKILVVISGKRGFTPKITLKCKLSKVSEICYTSGNYE